jgi:hypothetical protein
MAESLDWEKIGDYYNIMKVIPELDQTQMRLKVFELNLDPMGIMANSI